MTGSRQRHGGAAPSGAVPLRVVRKSLSAAPASVGLDDFDKHLITELQQDGRRSYSAMARAVGLSEAAVRQRVKRLLDDQVIQVVAVTDPLRLGFGLVAFVAIRVSGDIREVADALAAIPEVDYVVLAAGRYDLLLEVVCVDQQHLLRLLNEQVRPVPGVSELETFISLGLHKQTYTWGTR